MGRRRGQARCCGISLWCLLAVACVRAAGGSEKLDRTCRGAPVRVAFNSSTGPVTLQAFPALFGGALPVGGGPALRLGLADPAHGCNASADPARWTGHAVLARRGACSFADKARAAQAGNATLLILYNDDDTGCFGYLGAAANETGLEHMRTQVVSVSAAAGSELRELAGSKHGRVAAYYKQFSRLDPCELLLALIAVGTLVGGALWAGRDATAKQRGGGGSGDGGGAASADLPAQEVTPVLAAVFFVAASAVLLLLYLFINYIGIIMVVLFCSAAIQGMTLALGCLLLDAFPQMRKHNIRDVPLAYVVSCCTAVATAAMWAVCRNRDWAWVLQDALGATLIMFFIRTIQLPSLKVATLLLVAMFAYDVWWVFLQPLVTDSESVMITVATGGRSGIPIPMLFKVPGWHFAETGAYSMMGYGDVALPGLLAAFARIADLRMHKEAIAGYFTPAVSGYCVGLVLTYLALLFEWGGDQGQPALLYLVPSMLVPIVALAAARGELRGLWSGEYSKHRDSNGDESEHLVEPEGDHESEEIPV